ncbi:prohibitin [Physcia stellaris]|nr:prohibitin [Physcia stellaris]
MPGSGNVINVTRASLWAPHADVFMMVTISARAAENEFDYAGWRAYSTWKRRMYRQRLHQHEKIEDDCVFPSECRWSPESRAERLREDLEATLPELAEIGSTPTFESILGLPLQAKPEFKSDRVETTLDGRKSTNSTLRKLTKSTEQGSAKSATPLSPIEEEGGHTSTSLTEAASSKVIRPASRLSAYLEKLMKSFDGSQGIGQHTWAEDELADNIDMEDTDAERLYVKDHWFNEPLQRAVDLDKGSPETSPEGGKSDSDCINGFPELDEPSGNALFDFNLDQEDEIIASPRRNAWDWSPGDKIFGNIGLALSKPLKMDHGGEWLDEMDVD